MTKEKYEMKIYPWMRFKWLYAAISLTFLAIGAIAIISWGFPLGLDFTGGALIEYKYSGEVNTDQIKTQIEDAGVNISSVQQSGEGQFIVRSQFIDEQSRGKIVEGLKDVPDLEEVQYQNVGPSISIELIKKTIIAAIIASVAILLWVTYQFKNIVFGASAILAMLHDTFILLGSIAVFGNFFSAEADFLFVTALLTTLSFSVHDTIVVFDRIREIRSKHGGEFATLADRAVTETMRRSIVNSLTIIFVLLSLSFLGGVSIRWFAVALLVGAITGTYSSPFVAVPLLVTFNNLQKRLKKR